MPTIKAGDINLEYHVAGDGPPLLMIMGFAGQARTWGRPVIEELAKDFTTIRFSNRGTGLSDKPAEPFTIAQMAGDAIALLDALGHDGAVHVFGISMGGMIAQELALAHPDRVQRLVLGCTSAGGATNEAATPDTIQALLPAPGLTRDEMVRKAWTAICSPDFIENGSDFLERMMAEGVENPTPIETLGKQMVAISGHDTAARLAQIETPTLVIHGDVDRLVPPSNGDRLAAGIPDAEHRSMAGVAHMFFWERPEETAAMVTEFLSRVPAEA